MEGDWSVLLKPTVRRLLQPLLERPTTLTELADATGLSKPSVLRHLRELEGLGVVSRSFRNDGVIREAVYALEGCSLHVELRPGGEGRGSALTWASAGPSDAAHPLTAQIPKPSDRRDVVLALRALEAGVPEAWPSLLVVAFGSVVRGESTRKSDVDLLVVLPSADRHLQDRVADILADVQEEVTLPIQPFYTSRESFLAGRTTIEGVAAREGVVVHGPPGERELWDRMKRYATIST